MFANRVRVGGNRAVKAWNKKKGELRRKLRNSMNAAYRRGNKVLGDKKRSQLTKL
jgi:hypothetical protein